MPDVQRHPIRICLALLLTVLVHLMLLHALRLKSAPATKARQGPDIQWLLTVTPPPRPAPPVSDLPRRARHPAPAPSAPVTPAPAPATTAQPITVQPEPEFIPPHPSADDILRQARRDVGKIDQALRKEFPERGTPAPLDSKQARLERGINAAHDAVPPKWYEGAKITEIRTSGSTTRTYRIATALGEYCINVMQDGRKSYTNCPR